MSTAVMVLVTVTLPSTLPRGLSPGLALLTFAEKLSPGAPLLDGLTCQARARV
jgi:hypothetical protein